MRSEVWRPAATARNRAPGGPGPRPPSTTTWLRGARCTGCGGNAADGSAAPGRKIATVERREASVLRYWTQGASQAPGMSRHDMPQRMPLHPCACRRSAHPSWWAMISDPRARSRRGSELGCLKSEDVNTLLAERTKLLIGLMLRSIAAKRARAGGTFERGDASRSIGRHGSGPPSSFETRARKCESAGRIRRARSSGRGRRKLRVRP